MKKLLLLLAVSAALGACSKSQDKPAAPSAPPAVTAPAADPTSAAASVPAVSAADLPKECSAYIDKVATCVGKQSKAAADAMKTSLDQTKASWGSMGTDKAALSAACKAANDAFATQATAMKC
ncbi:hypothetical protein [Variovorax sp. W6]|uniref:hypothetical protein n=1 Tax=Variovorax sp. W6 TaxID=3093895 RepID=UPI003D80A3BF